MMSQVIRQETVVFLLSVLHGAGLAFVYDLIRCFRRVFRHGMAAVSIEDFLFWTLAGFMTFILAFFRTDGVIRGYVAAGIAIGVILYHFVLSAAVLTSFSWLLRGLGRIIHSILQIFLYPFKKICLILKKLIEFISKRGYNIFKKIIRGNSHGRKKAS